jgi:hypothetical protein
VSNIYPEDGSQAPGIRPETDIGLTPQPTVKEQLAGARDRVRGEAAQFASTAREKAVGAVEQRQQQVTGALGEFGDVIRRAADDLSERNQGMAAQVVRQAADSLEGLTRNLEGKTPGDLLNSARDFGRRHPVAFIGGTVLLGLAVGRFIRSSMPDTDYDEQSAYGAEWTDDTLRGDVRGLDANSQAFDADAADLTMSPDGAGASTLDTEPGVTDVDDKFGSTTRGA